MIEKELNTTKKKISAYTPQETSFFSGKRGGDFHSNLFKERNGTWL